jgi:dTMP kinase
MPFITFEGIDQSGKSTQIEKLCHALKRASIPFVNVREPGGTALGDRVREMLLGLEHDGMDAWTEALLYAAARAQLVAEVIRPALAEGRTVLSDRYIDSSLAYQGLARGLGLERVRDLNLWATGGLWPDLTLVLHLDVDSSRRRLSRRGDGRDRIESEPLDFHNRVEDGYHKLEEMFPDRLVGIDGGRGIDEVFGLIKSHCESRFGWKL